MKRAVQVTPVSRRLMTEADNPMTVVNLPPDPWFVRGPRGGLYVAVGERERFISETGDDWIRNTLSVVDRAPVKYVRPGTRLHQEAS